MCQDCDSELYGEDPDEDLEEFQQNSDREYDEWVDREMERFDEAMREIEDKFCVKRTFPSNIPFSSSNNSFWSDNKSKFWKHVLSHAALREAELGKFYSKDVTGTMTVNGDIL